MVTMVTRQVDLDSSYARDFASLCQLSGDRPCIRVSEDEEPLNVLKVMKSGDTEQILVEKDGRVVGTISALGALKGLMEKV